ncbi:MAG: NADH-quinone oxidoreductase subunit NuoK [Acidimicrobiia bacterium]
MTIVQFVLLGAALFSLGLYGVLTRRNAVLVLASVEVMLAAVNVNLVAFDVFLGDASSTGQVMALFIIALAAAEVGIGIAIVLMIFRNRRSADVDELDTMRN